MPHGRPPQSLVKHGTPAAVAHQVVPVNQIAGDARHERERAVGDGFVVGAALGGIVENDADNSPYAQQYFAGLLDRGFWHARPEDSVAFLFPYTAMSGTLGKVQAEEQELGILVSNAATGVQTHEIVLEANYNIHVYRGVRFRPEFEYVIRPNAQSSIRNAAVFGFKARMCNFDTGAQT